MPTSPMRDMGPCIMVYGWDESDAAELGKTLGGVKVTMETNAADILEDQAGDAAVNAVLTGSVVGVEATLTRLSAAQLARVLNVEVDSDGNVPIENQIGCDLYDLAKSLLIIPLCGNEPSDDPSQWLLLYKTYPVAGLELVYDKDTQRTFPVKFKVFVSQESATLGKFGTAGLPASASLLGA